MSDTDFSEESAIQQALDAKLKYENALDTLKRVREDEKEQIKTRLKKIAKQRNEAYNFIDSLKKVTKSKKIIEKIEKFMGGVNE